MRKLAVLTLCAGVVFAGDPPDRGEAFAEMVEANALAQLEDILTDENVGHMADEPETALAICRALADGAGKRSSDAKGRWRRIAKQILKLGKTAAERAPDNADALAAHGEALFMNARVYAAIGEKEHAADWAQAADLLLAAEKIEPGNGLLRERAVRVLYEGAGTPGAPAELQERAHKVMEEGLALFPANESLLDRFHRCELTRIDQLIAGDRKAGKEELEAYLARCQLKMGGAGSKTQMITAYNDAVTLAHRHKRLGVKAEYDMDTTLLGSRFLELSFPKGDRWKWRGGDLGTLRQYDLEGRLIRSISFRTYSWDTCYVIDNKEFGGDNLKGLARLGEYDVESVIINVMKKRPLRRSRLNRAIPQAQMLTIGGRDEDGDYLCWHLYYFKAKKTRMLTFRVSVLEFGELDDDDPELEAVIDSIREPGR